MILFRIVQNNCNRNKKNKKKGKFRALECDELGHPIEDYDEEDEEK